MFLSIKHVPAARRVLLVTALLIAAPVHAEKASGAKRIISLKPNITDIIYALGAGDKLAGVTQYCKLPKGARDIPVVADYTRPFLERIIALNPDVILASKENAIRRPIEKLSSMGYRVELFSFSSMEEIIESIQGIALAIGEKDRGREIAARMRDDLSSIKERWSHRPVKSAVVVVGARPFIVAGPGTYLDELLSLISVKNAVGESKIAYPRIDLEQLISMDPDAIVDLSMGSETDDRPTNKPWAGIKALRAVRDGQIVSADSAILRPSPRLTKVLYELGRELHRR